MLINSKKASKSFKPNKSPGYDSFSSNVVKEASNILFNSLNHISNLLLRPGIFPEYLKVARVFPIYKKDKDFLLTD